MNKIFQENFLDDPVFRLIAILKFIKKTFGKTTSKKFKVEGRQFRIYQQNPWKIPAKKFAF